MAKTIQSPSFSLSRELIERAEALEEKAQHFKRKGDFVKARRCVDLALYLRETAVECKALAASL